MSEISNFTPDQNNPPERMIVIAPNWHRFVHWCHDNGFSPWDRRVVAFITPDRIRGHRRKDGDRIVDLGLPSNLSIAEEMDINLRVAGFR